MRYGLRSDEECLQLDKPISVKTTLDELVESSRSSGYLECIDDMVTVLNEVSATSEGAAAQLTVLAILARMKELHP